MYEDSKVSLTESFREFLKEHPSKAEPADLRGLYSSVHDSLSEFLHRTSLQARAYHTVCRVYQELFPLLKEAPADALKEFLKQETSRITERLIDEKKLYGSLTENYFRDLLRKELEGYAQEDFIQKNIPVSLSHLADGTFLDRYASELKAMKEGNPSKEVLEMAEHYASEREEALLTLESLERGWDLLAEDEWELAERDMYFTVDEPEDAGEDFDWEGLYQDRAVRCYILVEAFRRSCTGEAVYDSYLLEDMMEFLGLHEA